MGESKLPKPAHQNAFMNDTSELKKQSVSSETCVGNSALVNVHVNVWHLSNTLYLRLYYLSLGYIGDTPNYCYYCPRENRLCKLCIMQ